MNMSIEKLHESLKRSIRENVTWHVKMSQVTF
jgi:hypothetical protein